MNRIPVICLAVVLCALAGAAQAADTPPNIVLILADDLRRFLENLPTVADVQKEE